MRTRDYFSIYYDSAETLLEAFKKDLLSTLANLDGEEKDKLASQHRNQLTEIWSFISKDLQIFPVNPLANVYLMEGYHSETKANINKGGLTAGTLRSRFTSLRFFIQFLRRMQIFAGMSRDQLLILEKSIEDFNKELNPYIKQILYRNSKTLWKNFRQVPCCQLWKEVSWKRIEIMELL